MQIVYNNKINEIRNTGNSTGSVKAPLTQTGFGDILNEKINLQFTKHANMRLNTRDISLSAEQMQRVESGVGKAKEKGIKESLVIVDNIALVVNTSSNMVITAMNNEKRDNVFTNIDGAVIV